MEQVSAISWEADLPTPVKIVRIGVPGKKLFIVSMNLKDSKWKLIGKKKSIALKYADFKEVYINPGLPNLNGMLNTSCDRN